jgi:hypothetical protein
MSGPEIGRAAIAAVAVRVYAACLGWGMLTGAVMGSLYLALSLLLDGKWDGSGGVAVLVGAAYGAPLGLLAAALLALGATLGAVVGARTGGTSAAGARRAGWAARAGFLLTAAITLVLWRYVFGGQSDNWTEWRLVLVVTLALVFGTWRAGRATHLALTARASVAGRR